MRVKTSTNFQRGQNSVFGIMELIVRFVAYLYNLDPDPGQPGP